MPTSPIADTYEPQVHCVLCDAQMHRTELDEHMIACLKIERGRNGPVERAVGDLTREQRQAIDDITQSRRRRGIWGSGGAR